MPGIKEQVFSKGEVLPELVPNTWRLYSMRLCPFAQRTRLVLSYKNVPYETVNIDLKKKPDWLFEKNPLGLVPVLEKDGAIVYESGICDDYLDEVFPDKPLYPSDPYLKARMKILMEYFAKVASAYFTLYFSEPADEKSIQSATIIKTALHKYEEELQGKFFGGNELSMLDLHIWPWFEREDILKKKGLDVMEGLPKLQAWCSNMRQQPAVMASLISSDVHCRFINTYIAGQPDYDIGL